MFGVAISHLNLLRIEAISMWRVLICCVEMQSLEREEGEEEERLFEGK